MEQKKISQQAMDCLLKMQQNEITEAAVYRAIAAFTKDDANKQVLLHLAEEEEAHYNIWKSYTGVELKPQKMKVFFRKICAAVLGFTFTIKLMEKGEKGAQSIYQGLYDEVPEARQIEADEEAHEVRLMEMLDEEFGKVLARRPEFPMPNWRELKAQMPDWDAIRKQYAREA